MADKSDGTPKKIKSITIENFRSIDSITLTAHDYMLLVGKNNAGKSAIIDALRIALESDKFNDVHDRSKVSSNPDDPKVTLEIASSNDSLTYHLQNSKNNPKSPIKLINIPAMTTTKDEMKTSGPSPFRNLIDTLLKSFLESNPEIKKDINEKYEKITTQLNDPESQFYPPIKQLNEKIELWGIKMDLQATPTTELLKAITLSFSDEHLTGKLEIESFGHGFQRQMIYELIHALALQKNNSKDESLNLILFDEPELYMHPTQQEHLARALQDLSKQDNYQIILATHSPIFASKSVDTELTNSLTRCQRLNGKTKVFQAKEDIWNKIRKKTEKAPKNGNETILIKDESFRFMAWLENQRMSLFFADTVLLVEGATERVLFEYLIDKNPDWTCFREEEICIVDILGKYNFHRYMLLLDAYGIKHGVLFDKDQKNDLWTSFIEESEIESTLNKPVAIEGNIEDFLGLKKQDRKDLKPVYMLHCLESHAICPKKLNALKKLFKAALAFPDDDQ